MGQGTVSYIWGLIWDPGSFFCHFMVNLLHGSIILDSGSRNQNHFLVYNFKLLGFGEGCTIMSDLLIILVFGVACYYKGTFLVSSFNASLA